MTLANVKPEKLLKLHFNPDAITQNYWSFIGTLHSNDTTLVKYLFEIHWEGKVYEYFYADHIRTDLSLGEMASAIMTRMIEQNEIR